MLSGIRWAPVQRAVQGQGGRWCGQSLGSGAGHVPCKRQVSSSHCEA